MNDFLSRLADRSQGTAQLAKPRQRSRFEPRAPSPLGGSSLPDLSTPRPPAQFPEEDHRFASPEESGLERPKSPNPISKSSLHPENRRSQSRESLRIREPRTPATPRSLPAVSHDQQSSKEARPETRRRDHEPKEARPTTPHHDHEKAPARRRTPATEGSRANEPARTAPADLVTSALLRTPRSPELGARPVAKDSERKPAEAIEAGTIRPERTPTPEELDARILAVLGESGSRTRVESRRLRSGPDGTRSGQGPEATREAFPSPTPPSLAAPSTGTPTLDAPARGPSITPPSITEAAQRRQEATATEREPVVTVKIGRIEVRAVAPPTPPRARRITGPKQSLGDYLQTRNERRRR